jgi:hypothetical protein
MNKVILLILFSTIVFISCKKEKFPDIDDLTGSWVELTDQSFKHRLIFKEVTMYFIKPTLTDTFLYRLETKQELLYLQLKNNPSGGESNHKIQINKKKNELIIWNLFGGHPGFISETKFKKE